YFNGVRFANGGFSSGNSAPEEGTSPAIVADIYQWRGNFTKTHSKHTFSMGAEFNSNGFQQTFNQNHLDFGSAQTASATSSGKGGFSVASLLIVVQGGDTSCDDIETDHQEREDDSCSQVHMRSEERHSLTSRYHTARVNQDT